MFGAKYYKWCLIVVALSGCDTFEPDGAERQEMESARAAWMRLGLNTYSYDYRRSCECRPEWTRPARVIVREGRVTEASDLTTASAMERVDYYPTVDKLFKRISDAFENGAYRIDITYDPVLYYPTSIYIDEDRNVADEEYVLQVTNLIRQ